MRKAAKRARYAYEALAALDVDGADTRRKDWKRVAKQFGTVQDAVILDEQLAVFAREAAVAGESTRVNEQLRERVGDGLDEELAAAREKLAAVIDSEPRIGRTTT